MTYEATDADLDAIAAAAAPSAPVETTAELLRRLTKERNEARAEVEASRKAIADVLALADRWESQAVQMDSLAVARHGLSDEVALQQRASLYRRRARELRRAITPDAPASEATKQED